MNIAERLIPFAINRVVNVRDVTDPMLRRVLANAQLVPHIRTELSKRDYELLVPYKVDDPEKQLKRYIQYRAGTKVDLTELRKKHAKYYKELFRYGSPKEVLRTWGLDTYTATRKESVLIRELRMASDSEVNGLRKKNPSLYNSLRYFAGKRGQRIKEYLKETGIEYNSRLGNR